MIAVLAIMLAGAGFAEEPKLSSDDVAVIKEALIHFASKTNYWNWSSTNEPLLLVELWSRESGKAECNTQTGPTSLSRKYHVAQVRWSTGGAVTGMTALMDSVKMVKQRASSLQLWLR